MLSAAAALPSRAPLFQATSSGLVARWPMDTFAANTTPDAVGSSAMTGTNTPTATKGLYSGGINLAGTAYLSTPDAPALNFGAGSFSFALWVRPVDTTSVRLINKWDGPLQQGWLMDIHSSAGGTATVGSIRVRLDSNNVSGQNGAADNFDYAVAAGLDSGNWRHLAATIDRTSNQLRIYMDGVQVGATGSIPATLTSVSNTFALGIGTIPTSLGKYYAGAVDDVQLYGRALTSFEVTSLYAGGYTAIAVGNPGPVVAKYGLLGTYYNSTTNLATPPTPASPTSIMASPDTASTKIIDQLDGPINSALTTTRPAGVNDDNFYVEWQGYIVTEAAGDYTMSVNIDDGGRLWFNQTPLTTTPSIDQWFTQPPKQYDFPVTGLAAEGKYPTRFEFFEAGVTQFAGLLWTVPGGASVAIPLVNLRPPDGPNAPGGLNAAGSSNNPVPQVTVTWNASTTPVAATSYVVSRSTSATGPFTQVGLVPGTTFTDSSVSFGTTYYYVVQGTAVNNLLVGPPTAASSGATPTPPPISVSPTGPITTSENGATATLRLTVNVSPTAAGTITISSSNAAQAIVSGQGNADASVQGPTSPITINILSGTAPGTFFDITVQGVRDFIDNGNQNYTISFAVGGGGAPWTGASIVPVNGTNLDVDTAALLINPTGGLFTDTNGGTAQFAVSLNSKPASGVVVVNIASSDPTEGIVSATQLTFTGITWQTPQTVTVTGQGTNVTFRNASYSVSVVVDPSSDALYAGPPPMSGTVAVLNIHKEIPPDLPHVWGGSGGGGGGCGLTGLEAMLLLGLGVAWRHRRRIS
jgi:hypothetical protein